MSSGEPANEAARLAAELEAARRRGAELETTAATAAQWRGVIQNLSDGFVLVDGNGVYVEVNPALCAMTGFSCDELIGAGPPHPFWPPEDHATIEAAFAKTPCGTPETRPLTFMRKDGTRFPVLVSPSVTTDAAGAVVSAFATNKDMTALKRAETEIAESERRYRLLLQNLNDAVYVHESTPDWPGAFVEVNDRACEMLGYTREELLTMEVEAIDVPEQAERLPAIMRRLYETGGAVFTTEHVAKDGRRIPVEVSTRLFDLRGRTTVLSVVRDISERVAAEAAVARAQRLLNETQEISRLGGWEYDVATERFSWTDEVYRIHGVDRDFDLNHLERNLAFYSPEYKVVIAEAFRGVLEDATPYDEEVEFRAADGRQLWVRTMARAEMRDGRVTRVIGNIMDITERKQAELQLQESEALFHSTLDAAGDGIVLQDHDGRILVWNSAAEHVFGVTETDALGQSALGRDWGAVHEDGSPWPVAEHPSLVTLETGRPQSGVIMGVRRDEAVRWITVNTRPVMRAHETEPHAVVVSFADFTERREAEKALRVSLSRLARAEPIAHVGGWTLDVERQEILVSAGWQKIHGCFQDRLPVADLLPIAHPDDRAALEECFMTAVAGGGPYEMEHRIVRQDDGEVRYVVVGGEPELDELGSVRRVHGAVVDITERRLAEEEIRRLNAVLEGRVASRMEQRDALNSELEAFAYSVAHDVRAPLRAIDGFSAMVAEDAADKLSADDLDRLRRVREAAQRMGQLIDDLMGLSRVARRDLLRATVDVSGLAAEVAEELRHETPGRTVAVSITPGMTANADPALLRIILRHLLGNAWKFTAKHETALIEVGVTDRDGRPAFYVRDDGVGFDPRYSGQLFGVFQRLHPAGDYPGDGIGLATVQRLVARHGGSVWAESEVDRGATFFFTLPSEGEPANGPTGDEDA